MLVLTRKLQEKLLIGENIVVQVLAVKGNQVRLGFSAPSEVKILREELYTLIRDLTRRNRYAIRAIPWANSIGLKTHSFRYQEQNVSMRLAEDLIANFGFIRDDLETESSMQRYFDDVP